MLNKVMLIGNLGQDPELRHTQGGTAILNLRLATNESYLQDGERKTRTEWHTVIVWGKRGEALLSHLQRGSRIFVDGRLQTRTYDRDGQKHYMTEIVANDIILLGDARGRARAPADAAQSTLGDDDDIPY
jgi:single-strand DNA-binding protein